MINEIKKKEKQSNKSQFNSKRMNELIIELYEKNELILDNRREKGAIDFKIFILDKYYQLAIIKKDKNDNWIKFFRLINKFLKNEIENIGFNVYKFLAAIINDKQNITSEKNLRAYNEILIYINENFQRIVDIWNINLNNNLSERKLSKNSFILLSYFSNMLIYAFQLYKNYIEHQNVQNNFFLTELKNQEKSLYKNIQKAINSIKIIEKDDFSINYKDLILEKYFLFLTQVVYLYYFLKKKLINKEDCELIYYILQFILKKTTDNETISITNKYFDDILKSTQNNIKNGEINLFNNEFLKNWKNFFDENIYLQNKYISNSKYNLIINNRISYFLSCLNNQGNNKQNKLFKDLSEYIIKDNLKTFKNLIKKITDVRINLKTKNQMICLLSFDSKDNFYINKLNFSNLLFFLQQITSFYHILYSLDLDIIWIYTKEERQKIKEIYQRDMLNINFEDIDDDYIQRNNLSFLFSILLNNNYNIYIYSEDEKLLDDFMKNSLIAVKNLIEKFIFILYNEKNNLYLNMINKISVQLSRFFFYFFYIFAKKRINHQNHDNQTDLIDKLLEMYIGLHSVDPNLFDIVFKKLMPYIFMLFKLGNNICPNKNCVMQQLIHTIFKNISNKRAKEILFINYFEYFCSKVYEIGNPVERFSINQKKYINQNLTLNDIVNKITLLKSIFYNLLDCLNDLDYYKNIIIPLVIDFLYLSKDSEYFGNYIYTLRCLFKYLKSSMNIIKTNNQRTEVGQKLKIIDDFNIEINYILYAILKYLINLKEKEQFLNDIILEIILSIQIKLKYFIDIPNLIFPSLVESLNNTSDNISLNLNYLDIWINSYDKKTETVLPFIQQNLSKITNLLSNNITNTNNNNICHTSLKMISNLGGKARNYSKQRKIITKVCPTQLLTVKLKEKNTGRIFDFILDSIIDIDIDNILNWSSKISNKKLVASLLDKKLINYYIEIYKNCLATFFHKKIDYDYIISVKKNIINGINFNEEEFNSCYSFKKMNEKNSIIKINSIFRKKEHFIIEKIITGIFLIYSSLPQILKDQKGQKEQDFYSINLMEFISNYFLLILLSKEKNNKNMLLFEIDPTIFIDKIIFFLFSKNPIIIGNTNIQYTEYSLKLINSIIDSIKSFFDNDNKIIKNLEIIEIIYMKFINSCYVNDSQKRDSGLMLLKILLKKFDKTINYKYLKYFIKCLMSITSNYSNVIKIKLKKGINMLAEIVDYLINMFVINDDNYYILKEEDFTDNNYNINEKNDENIDMPSDQEKEIMIETKNNFIMFFDFIKYSFDEIVEKIDSSNNYTRNFGIYLLNNIIGKFPLLQKILPILFQIDISNMTIVEFYRYLKDSRDPIDVRQIISNCNNNKIESKIKNIDNKKYILKNFNKTKIYKKMDLIFNALTKKLGIRDTNFINLIAYSDALNNIFNYSISLIKEYIFGNDKISLFLELIKSLYFNILISYFVYCQSYNCLSSIPHFKVKLIYLFIEKLYVEKNLEYKFKINDKEGKEIIIINEVKEEYIEFIEQYINKNEIKRNVINTRDNIVGELFEFFGLKINMIQQYIHLLNNIFNKINLDEYSINDAYKEQFNEYKIKTTKLIFIKIFNIHSSVILKESSSFLYNIFKKDSNLKELIYKENYNKIKMYIEKINEKEIKESNCALNQDIITGLPNDYLNTLLIICKCMQLNEGMKSALIEKIIIFKKIEETDFKSSQFVLFYGYISLFLYIDVKEEYIKNIFKQLLYRLKESIISSTKKLLFFNQTRYYKKIVKLLIKYRHYLSKFIIEFTDEKNYQSIFLFIKNLFDIKRNASITETIFMDITNKIKNEIILYNNNEDIEKNINRLVYLLKICKIISRYSPIYLKKTSFIEVIDDYIKKIINIYDNKYEELQDNIDYEKVMKYWLDFNKVYIENIKKKIKYFLSLFFYKSKKNVSNIEKNKIVVFLTHHIIILSNDKTKEKYKSLMQEFINLDDEIIKYFDLLVEYLIIPLMIRYLKNINYFKCFSVSINKDNYLKINIEKKDNKEESKEENDKNIINNEDFLLNLLETLTFKLYNTVFDNEKKEETKYKLISLLIVIYLEYLKQKNINYDYNDKTRNIYYNIQALLSNSPFSKDKNGLGLWRIYLLLDIILFSKKESNEQHIEMIYNFYNKLNEDYQNIGILANQSIILNSQNDKTLEKVFILYAQEENLLLKLPNIIHKLKVSMIKIILKKIDEQLRKNINKNKYFVELIGLVISYISKKRENINNENNENNENSNNINNITEIENWVFNLIRKLFIKLFFNDKNENEKNDNEKNDNDNFELLKKLIMYLRELLNSKTNFQLFLSPIEPKSMKYLMRNIHIHIQLLRIYLFNVKIDSIYKNLNLYLGIYKIMYDNNLSYRFFNDYFFVLRLLTDDKLLIQLNNKEKPDEKCLIEYRINLFNSIEEIIKDKNSMNKNYTNYNINDLFSGYDKNNDYSFYENILKKVYNYLISNNLYTDSNIQKNINGNSQNHNQINNDQQSTGNTTSINSYQQNIIFQENNKKKNNNINNNQYQQRNNILNDKWLETFHINDFKCFIIVRKFFDDFYSNLPETLANINSLNIVNNMQDNNCDTIKEKLEKILNNLTENLEKINSITFSIFENFYCFTLFFLKEYKSTYEIIFKKPEIFNSQFEEIKDYFSKSHNFYYNLRDIEDLQKIKTEQIDVILNEKDIDKSYNITQIKNMLIIYPDVILSGLFFFFECDEIVSKYYYELLELYLYIYRHFRDKFYDPLLEHLTNKIMQNKFLKDKPEEKNRFMYKLLISIEFIIPTKTNIRINENIIKIFINYLEYYATESNSNKKDQYILQSIRIIMFNIIKFDLQYKKKFFKLIKCFIGDSLIDNLKWIFTLDDVENPIYSFIFYETIPFTIDILLTHFQEGVPLIMNSNNYSKFKNLEYFEKNINSMEIENNNEIIINKNEDYKKYDKNNFIKKIVDNCNLITGEKKVEELLDPIRIVILSDNYSCKKIFTTVFTQIWEMLNMNEREILTIYINEFLYNSISKLKEKNNEIISLLFDTFSQCSPKIYIKPIIIQTLIPNQNLWCTNILYLENLILSGIDVEISYNSLINAFNSLHENGLSNGLKYYFSKSNYSKEAFNELQINNYTNAESIFYECFDKLKDDILDKINDDASYASLCLDENDNNIFNEKEFDLFNDLSFWENGLIDCYENSDKGDNIIELSEINNNIDLELNGLWYSGNEKWQYLDIFINNIPQYNKSENFIINNPYIIQLNEVYSKFKNFIIEQRNGDIKYRDIYLNYIKNIYQDFRTLYPKNLENINYYFFFVFQLMFEALESVNKQQKIIWRENIPHYCEGYKSIKSILEERNYLFNTLKIGGNNNNNDKIWTDMIFLKYSRKLNLVETFYEKLKKFENENRTKIVEFPYEIFCKDIEYIKFIRNNIHNYDLGIKICDECIKKFSVFKDKKDKDFISYVNNYFKEYKAYFNYKKGNIIDAHLLFIQLSINKNKEPTDYHLYYDWAEMCEEISILTKNEDSCSEWFENTMHNYLKTIIYKLDKAKYIIPRMINFIEEFDKESLKDKFIEEINQIPSWIWIFCLPILFENLNYYQNNKNKNDFFYLILKKVAYNYKQIIYYPYNIYQKIVNNECHDETEYPINKMYEELKEIIFSENKYDHCIDKINLIIDELTKKEQEEQENSLNAILNWCEMLTFTNQALFKVKNSFKNFISRLKNFPDFIQFTNNFEELMKKSDVTKEKLRECVIKSKYYNNNAIVMQNKFEKISKLCEDKIHNIDFSYIELPGYFSNKIQEPTAENIIYISKFESEYSQNFNFDASPKILIKCSNNKLLKFIIVNQDIKKNFDMKVYMMQILLNFIFEKNIQAYKRKIFFITPIKYHISFKIKIIEDDIYMKYNIAEIYEYCLQKRGYPPKIANQILEEEAKKEGISSDLAYFSSNNNEKLFYKMCEIIPQDSLKNFIHKFIETTEDIFIFRKQFSISYSLNNLFSYIISDNILLKNISFNKETGFCSFNSDLTIFPNNYFKDIIEQKEGTSLRLTKNISFFLSMTCIYGVVPEIFYFSCQSLLNKSSIFKNILKLCLDNNYINKSKNEIYQNYINKFKYLLNEFDDNEYFNNNNIQMINNISNESNNDNHINKNEQENNNKNKMKIIYELIDNSMNNENLKKKTIDYEAWF